MRHLYLGFALALLGASPLGAQCCAGAQNVAGVSDGGRYRVEATSLTGTGFSNHGPYRYRLQWSERGEDGTYQPAEPFELAFDTTAHFSMEIHVSPTGNGFLLATKLAPADVFYSKHGEALHVLDRARYQIGWYGPLQEDGFHVELWSAVPRPAPGGGANYDRMGFLFLPFAAPVDGALRAQLLALLQLSGEERAARRESAARLLAELDADDYDTRLRATESLALLGPLAVPAIEEALASDPSPELAGRARRILEELGPWRAAGGPAALDDPLVLAGLLTDPDHEVARAARSRLQALVPPEVAASLSAGGWREWAEENRPRR